MKLLRIAMALLLFIGIGILGWWYFRLGPVKASDGLPLFLLLPVTRFAQADPQWGHAPLAGNSQETLADAGCAVASAAMVLAYRGMDIDPNRLNSFLTALPGGYTSQRWIEWDKAAEYDPRLTASLLPHYEAAPSPFYLDWNLLNGNPVIVRVKSQNPARPNHFMVVVGKRGWDYLVQDPGSKRESTQGPYPLKHYCHSIEAIRFYNYVRRF